MMPRCLANCDNPNSSILVNVLSVWQPVRLLFWFSFMKIQAERKVLWRRDEEEHMYHKTGFAVAYLLAR